MKKVFFFILCLFLISSCKVGRYIFYNFADIHDYKKFPKRDLTASATPFVFYPKTNQKIPQHLSYNNKKYQIDTFLAKNNTLALLIIRNDTLLYEKYFQGKDEKLIVPSFSMAKSFTSALIGCAIQDGLIQSVEEPVSTYIPELKKHGFDKVKIKYLLQMTSGLKFSENYFNPFGKVASFYYGLRLRKQVTRLKLAYEPGTKFEYKSGNTELLGLVLERALKGKTITQYLQEKIWTPCQMEFDASWSIDQKNNGLEKTFCCINARARDFAKFGKLYLNKGTFNGKQLIPASWVEESTKPDTTQGAKPYYKYQWWLDKKGNYMAQGFLGQYIVVLPQKNMVIVKLSKNEAGIDWLSFFKTFANAL
ncbi:MAG: serine hydrolase [Bacteroidetes bacterium]|nr:serine hydrolase [Bacteroidota bacterium]